MTTFDPLPPIRKARMYPDGPELNVMLADPVQLWANAITAQILWQNSTIEVLSELYLYLDGQKPLDRAELKSAMTRAFEILYHYGLIDDEAGE